MAFTVFLASSLRLASLNLCSDEYLLLLARPGEAVSVSRLSHDPAESALAGVARSLPANRGRIEDILAVRPDVVLMMGGGGRSSVAIARSLGIRVLDLPPPDTVEDVARNLLVVATALGDPARAAPYLARMKALERGTTAVGVDTITLRHGGLSQSPGSLGAKWMTLAGMKQRPLPGGRASLEELATKPPTILLQSDYRSGQMSQGQQWLQHPLLARLQSRRIVTDGRAWTCGGPLMISEIERLRRQVR